MSFLSFFQANFVSLRVLLFVILSFIYVVFRPEPSWFAIFLKTLPVIYLCALVVDTILGSKLRSVPQYDASVLAGLVLSGFGDAALVNAADDKRFFILGLLLFALAHASYIYAFGLKPFNIKLFTFFAILGCGIHSLIHSGMARNGLAGLGGLYNILIMTMGWRALARQTSTGNQNARTWSVVGAILFVISDFVLGLNKFRAPIPYAQTIIMVNYYAGQLGIALSVFGRAN